MVTDQSFWKGKKVYVTGHTGFKGGWLALWLISMGAKVYGLALESREPRNFFNAVNLGALLSGNTYADIRDLNALKQSVKQVNPEVIFHLAAQPLVKNSYENPVDTFSTNIMGTINLLEASRQATSLQALVNVTSDKCYAVNKKNIYFKEDDRLSGDDPYSSSKACSELVTQAYKCSFMDPKNVYVATARAGNVIGGGDWADNRLIPDFIRAFENDKPLRIRSPQSIRPWQHVLEPLSGYLKLAQMLCLEGEKFCGAWNFGPDRKDTRTVMWILDYLAQTDRNCGWEYDRTVQFKETQVLQLDSTKSKDALGWRPKWTLETALETTLEWYDASKAKDKMQALSLNQIRQYEDSN